MKKCKCCELENSILEYIARNPRCTITEISRNINCKYIEVYRALEGREDSRANIGLVNNNYVRVVPGISSKGRLCWKYELI